MSGRKRFERERPFAARVDSSAQHLATTPMTSDQAQIAGLFAIAHALLDVSDSIRHHADTTGREKR